MSGILSLQKTQLRRRIWPCGPPGRLRCCCWVFSLAMPLLERDVVVGRRREVGALLLCPRRHELVAAAVTVAAAAEELDAVGDDLHGLALAAAVLRLPLTPLEAAVDRDRAALRKVLRAALRLVAEDRDAEVVRLVRPLARLVATPAIDGDAQVANGGAARRVPQLRVLRQVPDQNDAVDVGCHVYSSSSADSSAGCSSSEKGCSSAAAYSGSAVSETAVADRSG